MPENIKLSALTESTDEQMRDGALMLNSVIDSGSSTGFTSKKTTFSRFANYLLNKFTGLSLAGENQTVKEAVDGIKEEKADKSGYYADMHAGTADQVLSDSYTIDRTPYKYRRSPYTDRLSESIVGASVAWNQLQLNGNFESASGWTARQATISVANNVATVTPSSDGTARGLLASSAIQAVSGHKYVLQIDVKSPIASNLNLSFSGISGVVYPVQANAWTTAVVIYTASSSGNAYLYALIAGSTTTSQQILFRSAQVFDLTTMFGTTVADALYNMGDEGVKLFRSWYPKPYYAYSAPTMEHVSGLESHDMVGFNTFDIRASILGESINANTGAIRVSETAWRSDYIRCLAETDYYASGLTNTMNSMIGFYDADKNFLSRTSGAAAAYRNFTTPQGSAYFIITQYTSGTQTFTDGRDTVCINISDESMNGQYKPYEKHTYALDASLILRGLIKYDATKGFYADGDTYAPDGTVTRKYGIVDLGTLTWTRFANTSLAGGGGFQVRVRDRRLGPIFNHMISSKYVILSVLGASNIPSGTDKAIYTNQATSADVIYVIDSSYADAESFKTAMSGVYLVYELATPTTESAEPFDAIQITDGTEEYITDCLAPVGHESKYYENLRSKIEGLPTDFSAIICATEATNKASRNYAVGDYLIHNNTLYKVTAAIAANATLTVGTNITATTIMAEIKALQ